MPGWAVVGARKRRLYVMSWSAMLHGSVMNGWVEAVDQGVPHAALGGLVRQALAQSKTDVPMPDFRSSESPTNALLAAAGVKSYNGYALSAREVCVDLDDEVPGYLITPTRNGGAREGWVRSRREVGSGARGEPAAREAARPPGGRPAAVAPRVHAS